jgi:Sulfotransferase family
MGHHQVEAEGASGLLTAPGAETAHTPGEGAGPEIRGRLLLIGCPRSGTTLLQTLLAAHSQIGSFPEAMIFRPLVGQANVRWLGRPPATLWERLQHLAAGCRYRLGIARKSGRNRVRYFLAEINRSDLYHLFPQRGRSLREQVQGCLRILDQLAREQHKPYWLEKSVCNLGYIDLVERYAPDVRFIHIVRNGADVVASLYELAQKHPDRLWGGWNTIDKCIAQWNHALTVSRRYVGKPNHVVVSYQHLVKDTEGVLRRLCDFIGVPFEERMVSEHASSAKQLVEERAREWKQAVFGAIKDATGTKFNTVFTADQQRYLLDHLTPYSADEFEPAQTASR